MSSSTATEQSNGPSSEANLSEKNSRKLKAKLKKMRIVTPNISLTRKMRKNSPNAKYKRNQICTSKYSYIFFLFQNLREQFFGRYANIFFLTIQLINFMPGMEVFSKEAQLVPFIFVLGVTMVKDFYEDLQRRKADKAVNDTKCRRYDRNQHRFVQICWSDVCVGDIIHLSCEEKVPADILLLKAKSAEDDGDYGACYVDTSNLDGESNLKQRFVVSEFCQPNEQIEDMDFGFVLECDIPNLALSKFHGSIVYKDGRKIQANKDNLLLRDYVVKNTTYVEGLVVYAGHDTKAMLNNKGPRHKRSRLEKLMNFDLIWCILMLVVMCCFSSVSRSFWLDQFSMRQINQSKVPFILPESNAWAAQFDVFWDFFVFYILYQTIIPISLYVTIEFIKLGQIWLTINTDKNFIDSCTDKKLECRALNITEDLGQVEYMFCDKTGTLTENMMEFRCCTIMGKDYGHDPEVDRAELTYEQSFNALKNKSFRLNRKLKLKLENIAKEYSRKLDRDIEVVAENSDDFQPIKLELTEEEEKIRDFFVLMAICNTAMACNKNAHKDILNAKGDSRERLQRQRSTRRSNETKDLPFTPFGTSPTPTPSPVDVYNPKNRRLKLFDEIDEQSESSNSSKSKKAKPIYESESPDEVALVTAAFKYRVALLKRSKEYVKVMMPNGSLITYTVLHLIPFDSIRKRMSIIIRCPLTNRIILFCKGSDTTILSQVSTGKASELDNTKSNLTKYSTQGYRILCMARRFLTEDQYNSWFEEFQNCQLLPENEHRMSKCINSIESNLELIGATAIEDRLQYRVPEVIASLRAAGIVIWVLTGDKMETAINIANSCSLFNSKMKLITISLDTVKSKLSARNTLMEKIAFVRKEMDKSIDTGKADDTGEEKGQESTFLRVLRTLYLLLQFEKKVDFATPVERSRWGLVIDGPSLNFMLDKSNLSLFIELTQYCSSVLVCRATPSQKSSVVMCVKLKLNSLTLAVGDGANDVAMIQTAHVGVGISGLEGTQAVMAADFSVSKFHHLERLILVHGNQCYNRLALTILYFFYKNTLIIFIIFLFQFSCGFSGQTVIDDMYLMLVNIFFTTMPAGCRGIFEKDCEDEVLLQNPALYERGRCSRAYTSHSFWVNLTDSLYQSLVIYYLCYFVYNDTNVGFYAFGMTVFTIVIITNLLQIAMETKYWYPLYYWSYVLSFAAFYLTVLFSDFAHWEWVTYVFGDFHNLRVYMNIIQDPNFWLLNLVAPVLCLLPRATLRSIQELVKPQFQA